MIITRASTMPSTAMAVGTRCACIQTRAGAQITERNAASRKGTMIVEAAFIPAITMTRAAVTTRARPNADAFPIAGMVAF